MTLAERLDYTCENVNCTRSTDWPTPPSRAKFCRDCTDEFVRTGRLPIIPVRPVWLQRLTAKDLTGDIYDKAVA